MQDAGIDPDIDTYNAVIGACSRKDQAELAIRYFQDLQSRAQKSGSDKKGVLLEKGSFQKSPFSQGRNLPEWMLVKKFP